MNNGKKLTSRLMLVIFAMLLVVSGLITTKPVWAATPAEIPSQISMSLEGGAEEGKTAMSFSEIKGLTNNLGQAYGYGTGDESQFGGSKPPQSLVSTYEVTQRLQWPLPGTQRIFR